MNEKLGDQAFKEHTFAVVDAALVEDLPAGMLMEILAPKGLAASSHLMPRLIDLHRISYAQSEALFEFLCDPSAGEQGPRAVVLLRTSVDAPATMRHWNSMQLATPQPGHRSWLRLHDPRVLHQLLRVLNPAQRKKLFGMVQALTYWVGGAWVCATRDIPGQSEMPVKGSDAMSPYAGALMWDWGRIERIGLVNRALHGAAILDATELHSKGLLAEKLIERALAHGLVEQADQIEFAIRGLVFHYEFDRHPEIVHAIKSHSDHDARLTDRLALIPDHVWNGFRQSATPDGEYRNDHSK